MQSLTGPESLQLLQQMVCEAGKAAMRGREARLHRSAATTQDELSSRLQAR